MIWAAIIIPFFWGCERERKLSEIKHPKPRSHGKHGQAGLFSSSCVQVLLEELQSLLTAGKSFDSQGLHPHSRKQEHWNYLRKIGAFLEGTLQHTETPLGQKLKSRGLSTPNLGRWFNLSRCSHCQWCSPSVEKPECVRMAEMSPRNVLGREGSSPGCAVGVTPTPEPSPSPAQPLATPNLSK